MFYLSVVVCSMLAAAAATDVQQCSDLYLQPATTELILTSFRDSLDPEKGWQSFDLKNNVQLMPCKKLPCRLKKGSEQHITMTFIPDTDIKKLKNHVTATIAGVELPFVGVDGESICDKLENEAGEKVSCPLQAGTKYVYKDSFPILSFYPSIEVKVHWSLVHKDKDIICFEVPAKIS